MPGRRLPDSPASQGEGSSSRRRASGKPRPRSSTLQMADQEDEEDDLQVVKQAPDDDDPEEEDEDGEAGSPHGAKRARTGEPGSSAATPSGRKGKQVETPGGEGTPRPKTYLGERDEEGFVPGAIVRVACHNFMTYTDLEFFAGPRLNLVCAPNGTGKSSIVCAIALGLGFAPKILGRSDHLVHFVKHTFESAWVEIELKGRQGKRNPVIRRKMTIEDNKSNWTLNGQKVTHTKVAELVKDLNVQVDNLCSFLPQEKVTSFALMGPIDLLAETQRTAGHPKLLEWHQQLMSDGIEEAEIQAKITRLVDEQKTLQATINSMQRDVERFRQREEIQRKIEVLNLALPFAKYSRAKEEFDAAREESRHARKLMEDLEEADRPIQAQKEVFTILHNALEQRRKDLQKRQARATNAIKARVDTADRAANDSQKLREDLDALKSDERKRKDRIASLKREVAALEKDTEDVVEQPTCVEQKKALQEITKEFRQKVQATQEIQQKARETHDNLQDIVRQQAQLNQRLTDLKSTGNARMATLQKFMPHVYEGMRIINQLRKDGRLKGQVYNPVRLCINPTDPKYASAIEFALDSNILHTFLCTDESDYDLILNECNGKGRRGITAAILPPSDRLQNYPPPVPVDQIRQMGFENYLVDLVRGPEYVLTYLCNRAQLNRIPYTSDPRAQINEAPLQSLNAPIRSYITGFTRVNISFSAYGNREIILRSYNFGREARVLAEAGVDQRAIKDTEVDLATTAEHFADTKKKLEDLRAQEQASRAEGDPLEERKKELQAEMTAMNQAYKEYVKDVGKRDAKRKQLQVELGKPGLAEQQQDAQAKLRKSCGTRLKACIKLKEGIAEAHKLGDQSVQVRLQILQLDRDRSDFLEQLADADEALEEARQVFAAADTRRAQKKDEAIAIYNKAKKELDDASPELQEEVSKLKATGQLPPAHQLEASLESEKANLALTHDIGHAVIERYERSQTSLKAVENSLEAQRDRQDKIKTSLESVKNKWLPRLQELVKGIDERFDKAMKTMKNLGQVEILDEDPDYAKWGIQIKVKFRDEGDVLPLTAHRQSGGERSLATMMYLMSLAELAKAPFTLVDEINQGMDRRVERMVHNHLVAAGCRDDSAQSWIITPKLLANLDYDARMSIHCVFNGDWVPEPFDARGWLASAKAKRQRVA